MSSIKGKKTYLAKGKENILSGWKRSGIFDSIKNGSGSLPPLDPFNDLCPLQQNSVITEFLSFLSLLPVERECYRQKPIVDIEEDEEADSDRKEQIEDGNTFDAFNKM